MKATVTVFKWDGQKGSGESIQTISTLPSDFTGQKSGAEIAVHPNGKFLYASNRGHDSIALFHVDSAKGTLTADERTPTRGKTPRNFAIDPTGAFLFAANQDGNSIATFRIDPSTGRLSQLGDLIQTTLPVCIVFEAVK
jgi:6-phosphogluconolactonase